MSEIILRGRLDGTQRNRLKSLFDMFYSVRELAEELGITKDLIYLVYVPLGCPHQRDRINHISINGKEFAEWYKNVYAKTHLKPNETFCLTCKKAVEIYKPEKQRKASLIYLLSVCPNCGRKLTKILNEQKGQNDQ